MEIPDNLYYTNDHEWLRVEGNTGVIGITDFAQKELGDIVYLEIETINESLSSEDVFGTIEAVKTVSDLFMPVSGKVTEINPELESNPEIVNKDPFGEGWLIKIEIGDMGEVEKLLTSDAYKELTSV